MSGIFGDALSAWGKGQDRAQFQEQRAGFRTLDPKIQQFLLGTIFPSIQDWQAKGYQGIPMRKLSKLDNDPIFGSQVRRQYDAQQQLAAQKGM